MAARAGEPTTSTSGTVVETRPAARSVALAGPIMLAGLVVLAGVALQGRIPGVTPTARAEAAESPLAFGAALALLTASVLIMLVSLITAARRPKPGRPGGRDLPRGVVGEPLRLRWRALLVAVAAIGVVVLLIGVLGRIAVAPPEQPTVAGEVPAATAPGEPSEPAPARPPPSRDLSPYLAATAALLVLMAATGAVLARRRGPEPDSGPPRPPGESEPPAAPPLAVAAERGLAAVEDPSREPREAIIACYAVMERALAGTDAAPLASDTPSEVLARAVRSRAVRADSAEPLVALFAEARFSRHLMTESHRAAAEQALRRVLDEVGGRR